MPLAVAPTMPNFDPGEQNISDSSPRSSTGVGISSDEMTRGVCRLTPPKPFLFFPCDFLSYRDSSCPEAIYHRTALSILGDGGMPGGAFSGARRTNHRCTDRFRGQSVAISLWHTAGR